MRQWGERIVWRKLLGWIPAAWSGRGRPEVALVHHPDYSRATPGVPVDPRRGERILLYLRTRSLLRRAELLRARPASLARLLEVHSRDYLSDVERPEVLTRVLGHPVSAADAGRILEHQRLVVGGSLAAARWAFRTGGVGVNLGGGFHHASARQGTGFCLFNDVAVAIRALRRWGFRMRILVVDLDLHDGNGTREIFAADDSVHTLSIHGETWGSERALESTAIALGAGVDDSHYLRVLEETLPPLAARFSPGLVIYLAGADPAASDALGHWELSGEGMLARDRRVLELFRGVAGPLPLVITLAGGYGADAWRHSARSLAWLLGGEDSEPPPSAELPLSGAGTWSRRGGARGWDEVSFELKESDLPGLEAGRPGRGWFLGSLSPYAVELQLEQRGLLGALRNAGFPRFRLELDAEAATGDTLRILSGAEGGAPLVEIRVQRSRTVLRDLELLVIEWLLLQNPAGSFPTGERALPGQRHPGLGLLREILSWLLEVGGSLSLDGIYFTPSHYHVAVLSRKLARFLHPEHEGRMRALQAAMAHLPLAEAAWALEEGRVLDDRGELAAWEPHPMVLPASERLRRQVGGPEYEGAANETARRLRFRLRDAAAPEA